MPTRFSVFKERWKDCEACDLCEHRKHVVLLRGKIPSKVLFIGEAPGEGEDVLGQPFRGPAGRLLDQMIAEAAGVPLLEVDKLGFAFTNLICCIPRDDNQQKTKKPPRYAIKACSERLQECVELVRPELIVWVGEEAKKYGPKSILSDWTMKNNPYTVDIIHPGYILRNEDVYAKTTVMKRSIVILKGALETVKG